jgi:hypothetical protein
MTTASYSLDLVTVGTDPNLAWYDPDAGAIKFASSKGGNVTIEVADAHAPMLHGFGGDLALAVDSSGRPHIVYRPGDILHTVRDGATWSITTIATPDFDDPVRIAASSQGAVAIAWAEELGLVVAVGGSGTWMAQTVVPICNGKAFDLAYDGSGTLNVVHACNGPIELLTQSGLYPCDFADTCAQAATTVCQRAGTCGVNAKGGYCVGTGGGYSVCPYPEWYCEYTIAAQLCGDATKDPTVLYGCRDALPQSTCPTGMPGVLLPMACTSLF